MNGPPVRCASCGFAGVAHVGWVQADGAWCCPSCLGPSIEIPPGFKGTVTLSIGGKAAPPVAIANDTDKPQRLVVRASPARSLAGRLRTSEDGEERIVGGSGRMGGRGHE